MPKNALPQTYAVTLAHNNDYSYSPDIVLGNAGNKVIINYNIIFSSLLSKRQLGAKDEERAFDDISKKLTQVDAALKDTKGIRNVLEPGAKIGFTNSDQIINSLQHQEIFTGTSFQYMFVVLSFHEKLDGPKLYAKLCAKLAPYNGITQLPCENGNFLHRDSLKDR